MITSAIDAAGPCPPASPPQPPSPRPAAERKDPGVNHSSSRSASPQGTPSPRRRLAATVAVAAAAVLTVSALPTGTATAFAPSGTSPTVEALPHVKATPRAGAAAVDLSPGQRRRLLDRAAKA